MYDKSKTNAPARFLLLLLAFACAAVTVYSLRDMLPAARYILTPCEDIQTFSSPLTLSLPAFFPVAEGMRTVSGIALEAVIWFLGGLTVCAGPVFFLASAFRGACFGYVLSLITGGFLAGWNIFSLVGWVAVTVLLFCFACGLSTPADGRAFCRYTLRFLVCAGASFWITMLGNYIIK